MTPPSPDTPEGRARRQIDEMLRASGWVVQDRADLDLSAGPGVAVREFWTDAGPGDYAMFVGNWAAGVIEAKKLGTILSGVESQTRAYAESLPKALQAPVRPLPFLFETTGEETWFTNGLDPVARARRVFSFHRPETLRQWLEAEVNRREGKPGAPTAPTLQGRMQLAPPLNPGKMWAPQITAVQNLEESIRAGHPRALIHMTTGSGKTYTAISALYRLVKEGGARRALFLVDRGNLGQQAHTEFQGFETPDDGRKFTELYPVTNLAHNSVDPVNKVVITTIQRLYSILKGEEDLPEDLETGSAFLGSGAAAVREPPPVAYSADLPPDFFDLIVVDECHRSIYSVWRQVLEYFDASIIGLTATPVARTYAFFNRNVVSEYRHEQAVRDRVNVPFQVYEIRTKVGTEGGRVKAGPHTVVARRDRMTRAIRWEMLDEDLEYGATDLDRSVVVQDQIRTVVRTFKEKIFTEIFPGRKEIPKTLIFAKSDDHAEDILRIVREEFGLSNEGAVKITYRPERETEGGGRTSASHRPAELIKAFKNSFNPRIAVTVDMIATGTDVKPLECVVFMRSVKSRGLFDQMKGRGVRIMKDADFQAVTPDAKTKTHFVIVDCVGVMEEQKSEPQLDREPTVPLKKILEMIRAGSRDKEILSTLAARLDRMDRQLTDDQQEQIEAEAGGTTLRTIVGGLLEAIDADKEDERAREMFGLDPQAEPTEEQVAEAQSDLREKAAAPIAYAPNLCNALLDIRRLQEVALDHETLDEVVHAGTRGDLAIDYDADKAMVSQFEEYCRDHLHDIEALEVIYSRPYAQRLTRAQLVELLKAIQRPPRQWTPEKLWQAYERVEEGRVRGASKGRLLTDLISLARHALGVEDELVSYQEKANERFQGWMAQQANNGREFTGEHRLWLELIRDRIVADMEIRMEDFDELPFANRGGLGKAWALFGDDLGEIVDDLNRELVA